jgi:hypothetical protein
MAPTLLAAGCSGPKMRDVPDGFGAWAVMRWTRAVVACAALIALAAPAALGPAMTAVLHELGAASAHVCKCGMAVGKCGCPECDRLELERRLGHRASALPTLKRACDDDEAAIPFGSLPSATLVESVLLPPAPPSSRVDATPVADTPPHWTTSPPTPPPRRA